MRVLQRILLHYIIDTKNWITLAESNHAIQTHHYGYTESHTKPSEINRGQSIDADFQIRQSGMNKDKYT